MLEWILWGFYIVGGAFAARGLYLIWRANKKINEILEILKENDDDQNNPSGE